MNKGAHSQHGSFLSGHTSDPSAVNPSTGAGIKAFNINTSQDASTASNIPSNPQLEHNLNATTDVDPSSRESGNNASPDQQSAPYGSSTPNNPSQAGKSSYPDSGTNGPSYDHHIPINGYQQPTGFAYMPFPYYGQLPGYYSPINPIQPMFPGSPNHSCTYNNPYIPTTLFYCSSVGLFNSWVHSLIKHLIASGLKDLVPDSHDRTVRDPTPEESQGLINLFFTLVPQSSYPDWVQECFHKQMHPYDVIRQAMTYDIERSNVNTIINTIRSLKYNGGYPAFQFTSYLHNLIDQLNPTDLQTHEYLLKQTILDTLTGTYESISKHFFKSDTPYTINDIFSSIKREYQYYHQASQISDPHFSPNPPSSSKKQYPTNPSVNKRANNTSTVLNTKNTTVPSTVKPKAKSTKARSKKVSQVKTHSNSTSIPQQNNPVDPTLLRPISTSLNPAYYMMLDSGATVTLVKHKEMLHNLRDSHPESVQITSCSNTDIPYDQEGDLILKTLNGSQIKIHAFYTPTIDHTILSTSDLRSHHLFLNERLNTIEDANGDVAANIDSSNGLHWLSNHHIVFPSTATRKSVNALKTKFPLDMIHRILGHVNVQSIYTSIKNKTFNNLSIDEIDWSNLNNFQCQDCLKGKSRKRPHIVGSRLQYQQVFKPFQYIHSDLFGPVTVATKPEWFISFTDEASKFKWTYLLKRKDDATILHVLKSFIATIERQFKTPILKFQFDRGTEYTNSAVKTFLSENGIQIVYTDAGDSQAHGVAERLNLTLLNDCRTIMNSAKLPHHLWYYAVQYATIIRNSIYNNSMRDSPRSKVGLLGLDTKSLLPFGQPVIINLNKTASKLHVRGEKGFALIPDAESYGYLFYLPTKRRVVSSSNFVPIKHDVDIHENEEYDDSIFDDLITTFISKFEHTTSSKDEIEATPSDNHKDTVLSTLSSSPKSSSLVNKDPLFKDKILIQNDADADLNITTNTTSNSNPSNNHTTHPTSSDLEELITPIDINDPNQLPLTLVEPSSHPTSDESSPLPTAVSTDTTSSSTPPSSNRSSKLTPIPTDNFYVDNSTLGGTRSGNRQKNTNVETPEPVDAKERQKRDRDERTKARIGKRRKTTKTYAVNYIAATRHTINQVSSEENNQHGPLQYFQAITHNRDPIEKEKFQEAYDKEISQLTKMGTWSVKTIEATEVDKSKIINSMFIFSVKRDGHHKCRLVARGDQQKASTYQPDLMSNTVHHYALMSCLSIALQNNYDIIQLDISSAYLYAPLEEELYIRSPPHLGLRNTVHRLKKSLYGLKQSGANWYKKITNFIINSCHMNFVPGWPCVFYKKINDSIVILCLFVDDMVLLTNNRQLINDLISQLQSQFETKVVNDGAQKINQYDVLGLEIEYIKGLSMKMGMAKSLEEKLPNLRVDLNKSRKVPGTPNEIIREREFYPTEQEYKNKVKWLQKAIGLASYVGYKYRYDILYYVNTLARHTLYPSKQVMSLTKQLIQFIWSTRNKRLIWHKTSNSNINYLTAVTDAAFANQHDMKSQFGNMYYLNGNLIGARSSKSTITCTSSTESEIYSICEAIPRLRNLNVLIQAISDKEVRCSILTDSQTSLHQIKVRDISKIKNKFYGTKVLRIAEEIENDNISVNYINTSQNVADILTKPLSVKIFAKLTENWIY